MDLVIGVSAFVSFSPSLERDLIVDPHAARTGRSVIDRTLTARGRLSKKFIVGKLQCFDNFFALPNVAVSAPPRRSGTYILERS